MTDYIALGEYFLPRESGEQLVMSPSLKGNNKMNPNATKCTFGHSDVFYWKTTQKRKKHVTYDLEITLYL